MTTTFCANELSIMCVDMRVKKEDNCCLDHNSCVNITCFKCCVKCCRAPDAACAHDKARVHVTHMHVELDLIRSLHAAPYYYTTHVVYNAERVAYCTL